MKNDKGSILISLLMIIIVLSTLSIAVYSISYSANKQAIITRDKSQAYYVAKSGADLVIAHIEKIIEDVNDDSEKTFKISFSDEGTANVLIELVKKNNVLEDIYIHSVGEVNGSKSVLNVKLTGKKTLAGSVIILGVDKDGNLHEFDKDFNEVSSDETIIKKPKKNIDEPKSFAWNNSDTLVLVGISKGNNSSTLIYDFSKEDWIELKHKGNDYNFVIWSQENRFYSTQPKDGHIYYLDNNMWEKMDKPTSGFQGGFKIEKLAQGIIEGKNILIGMAQSGHNYIALKENKEDWLKIETKLYGTYNDITYGNGKFIIVGSEGGYPLIIYSEDGVTWEKGEIATLDIGYQLNAITWTGEKFVAVGDENTIYSSIDGKKWYKFPREDITYVAESRYYYDLNHISSIGNYLITYSEDGNSVLISDDGGISWKQKKDNTYPKLRDIIVINKGNGAMNFTNSDILWAK